MFWKVLRHVFVPSNGLDEKYIKGAFYPGVHLSPLYPTLRNFYFIIFLPKLSLNGRTLISECERISDIHVLTAAFEAVSASQYIFILVENTGKLLKSFLFCWQMYKWFSLQVWEDVWCMLSLQHVCGVCVHNHEKISVLIYFKLSEMYCFICNL